MISGRRSAPNPLLVLECMDGVGERIWASNGRGCISKVPSNMSLMARHRRERVLENR
jgi:hypothetical protein